MTMLFQFLCRDFWNDSMYVKKVGAVIDDSSLWHSEERVRTSNPKFEVVQLHNTIFIISATQSICPENLENYFLVKAAEKAPGS